MDYLVTDTELTSVADAIRTKGGTSADLVFPADFVSAIGNIESGIDYNAVADHNFGEGDDVIITATLVRDYAFSTSNIHSIHAENSVAPNTGAFLNCKKLVSVYFPNATDFWGKNNVFQGCTSLTDVNLPKAYRLGNNEFYGCTSLEKLYIPKMYQAHNSCFQGCTNLTHLETNESINFSAQNGLNGDTKLMTIIMRGSTVRALSNVNNFNNTTFAANGSHLGHIYVPSSLIASYQTANNWSTLYASYNDIFLPIEGSEWETVHIDGTPVE